MSERPIVIIGNWKMHKVLGEASQFVEELIPSLKGTNQVGLAVPFTLIFPLAEKAQGSFLRIGAQNMNDASEGSFTGEVAGRMLKDSGAQFVILGHSERRRFFHEENAFINRKVKRAIESGLQPILCVGENLEEKESNQTEVVLRTQLEEGLRGITSEKLDRLIIAYEPVWAIGTGQSADPNVVQKMHLFCRSVLKELFSDEFSQKVIIQYGGSVNEENASNLLKEKDIDGLLVGGVSLSLESFRKIVNDEYSKNQSEG